MAKPPFRQGAGAFWRCLGRDLLQPTGNPVYAPQKGAAMTKRELILYVAIPLNALIFVCAYAWLS
jgi:hypothetical protein